METLNVKKIRKDASFEKDYLGVECLVLLV